MQAIFAAGADGVGAIGASGALKWTNAVASSAQFGLRLGNCANSPDDRRMVDEWVDALDCIKGTSVKDVIASASTCAAKKIVCTPVITSCDPNEIIGPDGYRPQGYVAAVPPLPYKVLFENDPKAATTSAQRVSVRVPIDANLNPLSVQLGSVGFQRLTLAVPAGLAAYNTIYRVADSVGVDVEMTAGVDIAAREVFWEFQALDRFTGLAPADPLAGFLPPNDSIASGEGFVTYTVRPRRGVVTGDSIRAKARIVFDFNDVIATNREVNIVDAVAPVSFVRPIAPRADNQYLLRVSIQDDPGGSGPKAFEVFVSEDNGLTYNALAGAFAGDTVTFSAQPGRSYFFYSLATDNVDNPEGDKTTFEAVISPCPVATNAVVSNITSTTATVGFATAGPLVSGGYRATATPTGGGPAVSVSGPASPLSLSGLTLGTAYALTLTSRCGTDSTTGPVLLFSTLGLPLATGTVAPTSYCQGQDVDVPLGANTAGFGTGNQFRVQLSDAAGAFAATAPLLGTLLSSSASGGVVRASIPASTPPGTGYRVRVVASLPATTGTPSAQNLTVTDASVLTWTGAAGTSNWFETGNWSCGQVPDATRDLMLPAGRPRYPVLPATGPVPAARNLTLAPGASLTLGNALALSGNLTNNGTLNAGSSTLTLAGITPQTLGGGGGTVLFNLTLDNPAGASLLGPLAVRRVLTLTAGNLASGGRLTLRSDATGTAMVVNPGGGGLVTGPATMERFIGNASGAGYRHYASPMQGGTATVQEFADDLPGFNLNPACNTTDNTVSPFPTFFQYDEARLATPATDFFDRGWRVPLATENLAPGRGYTAQTANATLVDISGTLAHADVNLNLTRGAFANSGWHLLGNPFHSPLDWDLVPAAPGIGRALYVFVPSGPYTGTYRSYLPNPVPGQPGIGQNGGTKDVAAMQGYFVRSTANGSALVLPAAARPNTYADPRPLLRLQVANAAGQTDETVIYFDPAAAAGFSPAHDAHQVQRNGNGFPSLWSEASGPTGPVALSINGLPDVLRAPSIPLGVVVSASGPHTLSAPALLNLPAGTEVWLEDQALSRRHNLSQQPRYAFQMAASFRGPRFVLWLQQRPTSTAPNAALQANLRLYPNPATSTATVELAGATGPAELTLTNVLGQVVQRRTATPRTGALCEELDLRELPAGVYLLHVGTAAGHATRRLLRE